MLCDKNKILSSPCKIQTTYLENVFYILYKTALVKYTHIQIDRHIHAHTYIYLYSLYIRWMNGKIDDRQIDTRK